MNGARENNRCSVLVVFRRDWSQVMGPATDLDVRPAAGCYWVRYLK